MSKNIKIDGCEYKQITVGDNVLLGGDFVQLQGIVNNVIIRTRGIVQHRKHDSDDTIIELKNDIYPESKIIFSTVSITNDNVQPNTELGVPFYINISRLDYVNELIKKSYDLYVLGDNLNYANSIILSGNVNSIVESMLKYQDKNSVFDTDLELMLMLGKIRDVIYGENEINKIKSMINHSYTSLNVLKETNRLDSTNINDNVLTDVKSEAKIYLDRAIVNLMRLCDVTLIDPKVYDIFGLLHYIKN